jgi:hypothetical protein
MNIEDIEDKINRHGAEAARRAHNPEDLGSKPSVGTSPYRVHRSVRTTPRQSKKINRGGAEEARGAHNPEVIGSNPISGTSPYRVHRSVRTTPRHHDIEEKNQPTWRRGSAQGS